MYCPIFHLGELVRWSGYDFQDMAVKASSLLTFNVHLKTPVLMSLEFASLRGMMNVKVAH